MSRWIESAAFGPGFGNWCAGSSVADRKIDNFHFAYLAGRKTTSWPNVVAVDGNKLTIAFGKAGEKRVVDGFVDKL